MKMVRGKRVRAALMLIALMLVAVPGGCGEMAAMLEAARQGGRYVTPAASELAAAQQLFSHLFEAGCDRRAGEMAAGLGMSCRTVEEAERQYAVLSEMPGKRNGRGFYLFSRESDTRHLLQMPHGFKDLNTDRIGLQLVTAGRFTAAAWNTVPRRYVENGREIAADLSDLFDTYFAALSLAYVRRPENGYVIQLHGYDPKKRHSAAGRGAEMILSTGSDRAPSWLMGLDACMGRAFAKDVRYFPVEIRELGATRTSIGILLREQGIARFLHIEMSASLRRQLLKDPESRQRFLVCLEQELP